uniref:Uncharacterized protein n=1 Tax=Glossina pallidipes TaxID=7398 RepID=A0A1B0A2I2_GLOPL
MLCESVTQLTQPSLLKYFERMLLGADLMMNELETVYSLLSCAYMNCFTLEPSLFKRPKEEKNRVERNTTGYNVYVHDKELRSGLETIIKVVPCYVLCSNGFLCHDKTLAVS